ncbi:hypothetical protein [Nocardia crassostreae]|uniref:hypothetical protein n=1 Tax=Nocardia crassostreae TaxID=53428 RepID=UPI00082A74F2|nr:hypothetical protein [Nocardia crassostreae]
MGSQRRSEPLVAQVDRLAKAVAGSHAVISEGGISVDVRADGRIVAIHFDEGRVPDGGRLGAVLTDMINRARAQAQARVGEVVREVGSDPRVTRMVEQIHDSPDLAVPEPLASAADGYEPDSEFIRGRSRIADLDW